MNCSTPLPFYSSYPYTTTLPDSGDTQSGSIYAGIFLPFLVIVTVAGGFGTYRYRRNIKNLKSQRVHGYYSETAGLGVGNSSHDDHTYSLPEFSRNNTQSTTYSLLPSQDNLKILPSYPSYTNGDSGEKISPRMFDNGLPHPPLTGHMVTSTPVKSSVPTIRVSEPDLSHGVKDDIYEELKNQHNQSSTPMIDLEDGEGYDHLDFRRPVNDLKPQYLSSESILGSRSRNSSNHSSEKVIPIPQVSGDTSRQPSPGNTSDRSMRSDKDCDKSNLSSDQDWTDSVLNSLEKLNQSGSRTRTCIYQPDSDESSNMVQPNI